MFTDDAVLVLANGTVTVGSTKHHITTSLDQRLLDGPVAYSAGGHDGVVPAGGAITLSSADWVHHGSVAYAFPLTLETHGSVGNHTRDHVGGRDRNHDITSRHDSTRRHVRSATSGGSQCADCIEGISVDEQGSSVPEPVTVSLSAHAQRGSWFDITQGDNTTVVKDVFTAFIDHGLLSNGASLTHA